MQKLEANGVPTEFWPVFDLQFLDAPGEEPLSFVKLFGLTHMQICDFVGAAMKFGMPTSFLLFRRVKEFLGSQEHPSELLSLSTVPKQDFDQFANYLSRLARSAGQLKDLAE